MERLLNFGYFIKNYFYCNSQSFRDCSEAPFLNWKMLLIGIITNQYKGDLKKCPHVTSRWAYPSHATCNQGSFASYRASGPRLISRYCIQPPMTPQVPIHFLKLKMHFQNYTTALCTGMNGWLTNIVFGLFAKDVVIQASRVLM